MAHVVAAPPERQGCGEGDVDRGSEPPENRADMGDRRTLLVIALALTPRESKGAEPAADPAAPPAPEVSAPSAEATTQVEPEQRRAYEVAPDDPIVGASARAVAAASLARELAGDGVEWLLRAPQARVSP